MSGNARFEDRTDAGQALAAMLHGRTKPTTDDVVFEAQALCRQFGDAGTRVDALRDVVRIDVHLQPNARATGFAGMHGVALKIRVSAPPADQRANDMLVRFVADTLGIALSRVSILRGSKSRSKLVQIAGCDPELLRRLEALC